MEWLEIHKIDPRQIEVVARRRQCNEGISEPYELANRAFHPEDTIVDVSRCQSRWRSLASIAGPCSVAVEEQVIEIAKAAKTAGANILRGGALDQEHLLMHSREWDLQD